MSILRSSFILILLIPTFLFCQNFSKITSGAIVNDGGQSYGCSWFDIDEDQDLDLFVCDLQGTNFLYLNNGDGTFEKVNDHPLFEPMVLNLGHSWIDYDNDCDTDFYQSKGGQNFLHPNYLFENEDGVFEKVEDGIIVEDLGQSQSSNWADIDRDGDLDLFIANLEGQDNFLYLNNGDKTFTKVTNSPVLNFPESNYASFVDIDNDGFQDLFICNRFDQNNALLINQGDGNFEPLMDDIIVMDGGNSYSSTWGDFNNDGYFDCFVSNNVNQVNFLYKNNGNRTFEKVLTGDVVTDITDSYSSNFADIDSDGDLDLLVMNAGNQRNRLYRNDGNGNFTSDTNSPVYTDISNSRGSTVGDMDNDGDLDLFVANRNNQDNFLYENTTTNEHWLKIRCYGSSSNFSAIGTRIKVRANINGAFVNQYRFISSESSYASNNGLELHFGLGDASIIDSIQIYWPNGGYADMIQKKVDQYLILHENDGTPLLIIRDTVNIGESITLTAPSENFFWHQSTAPYFTEKSRTFTFENLQSNTSIYATATNACAENRQIQYQVFVRNPKFDIPNAFTPNGDGINDIFKVAVEMQVSIIDFKVYDRWGNLVFEAQNNEGWNGEKNGNPAAADVYIYQITLMDSSNKLQVLSNDVTLIR